MSTPSKTVWETLSVVDVSDHVESKNGFTYLSWAWAWSTLKSFYPEASYKKHTSEKTELPFFIDPVTSNAYVIVTVEAGGESATEVYPVLDYSNKPVPKPNAFQVNTALQRCMAKAIAYLGLGCYIYAGEDLPPGKPAELVSATVDPCVDGEEVKEGTGVKMIAKFFDEFIPMHKDVDSLKKFWNNNTSGLDILKTKSPALYEQVLTAFKKRNNEISKEKKEKAA